MLQSEVLAESAGPCVAEDTGLGAAFVMVQGTGKTENKGCCAADEFVGAAAIRWDSPSAARANSPTRVAAWRSDDGTNVGGGSEFATIGPTDCALLIDKMKAQETCRYTSCNPLFTATGPSNILSKSL